MTHHIKKTIERRPGKQTDGQPLPPVTNPAKPRRAPSHAQIEARMAREELRRLDRSRAKLKRDYDNEFSRLQLESEKINRKLLAVSKRCKTAMSKIDHRRGIILGRLA